MSENIPQSEQNVPVLEIRNISKRFGYVQALNNVSMKVYKGDVIGLLGDNGAGKSTLIKMISGNFPPDEGKIFFEGKETNFNTPTKARAAGIETVYQNSSICENVSVFENFFLGRELVHNFLGLKIIRSNEMQKETLKALKDTEIQIPSLKTNMITLSGGQRQAVILSRFFYWGGKIALLDEPFAALGVTETVKSLKLIRNISLKGLPIVLVTHDVEQVFQVATKYVVLRQGSIVGEGKVEDVSKENIVAMITGAINIKD